MARSRWLCREASFANSLAYNGWARLLEEAGEDDDPASVLAAFNKPDDSD